MKKVTLFIAFISILSTGFAMTSRYSIAQYERLENLPPVSRPVFGTMIFNSAEQFGSWNMARSKAAPEPVDFDFTNNSLLLAYLGKSGDNKCIKITRIDETEKYFVLYAEPTKCSSEWAHPYIYFKLKKTDKIAKIIMK